MIPPAIFTFGIPRSGTTFAQRWLMSLPPEMAHVVKIAEHSSLHPWNSDDGLISLRHLYADRPVLFVWIWREPENVFRSFHTAKYVKQTGHKEQIETPMKGILGIAENSNKKVFRFIDVITANAEKQNGALIGKNIMVRILKVQYGKLGESNYQAEVSRNIALALKRKDEKIGREILYRYLKNHYGKKPVREGALSHGLIGKVELPEGLKRKIRERYG